MSKPDWYAHLPPLPLSKTENDVVDAVGDPVCKTENPLHAWCIVEALNALAEPSDTAEPSKPKRGK